MAANLVGGAALGAVFGELLISIKKVRKKALLLKPILGRMETTLEDIIPIVKEIEGLNKVLDRRKEETGKLIEQIMKGKKLVLECSNMPWYACWKRPRYTDKLLNLERSLKSFCQIVGQLQQTRDIRETLLEVKDMRVDLKRLTLKGNIGVTHNRNGFIDSCTVPEPPVNPVGLEMRLGELKMELFKDGVSTVVVSAPPGCGKTTLAKLFCHDKEVQEKFKENIFYAIVAKKLTLEGIVQRLFQHKGYQVPDLQGDEGVVHYYLEQFLKKIGPNPILLVLDDVWPESVSLLEKFRFLIADYKILVTSRSVFPNFGSTYKLKPLNPEDAMTLFWNSASLQDQSPDIPDENVVNKIVQGCKGFPLALKVVGRSLCGEPAEIWKNRAMELSKGGSIFEYDDVLKCLQRSLDSLDNKLKIKECFMDLCSFPEDQRIPVTSLIDMWAELYKMDEDGMRAVANLHDLSTRNLVDLFVTRKDLSDCYDQHFVMQHDLLRELAIHLSNPQSIKWTKRLILEISANNFPDWWMEQKQLRTSSRLLSITTDEKFSSSWVTMQAPEVEVLVLNFQTKNYTLPEFVEKMEKLKVLIVTNYGFFPSELSNFPLLGSVSNLKRIRLEKVSIPSFSFTSVRLKNLQKLTLVMCYIGQAFGTSTSQVSDALPNVVEINIDYCNDMVELPVGLCHLSQLKKLSITNCHKLATLHEEMDKLINLEVLRLGSCIELFELPDTIGSLKKLSILDISECSEIHRLPQQFGELHSLRKLNMMGCSRNCELPPSILNLKDLEEVICDEETASLWEPFAHLLKNLRIKVHKEDINLNWLYNGRF